MAPILDLAAHGLVSSGRSAPLPRGPETVAAVLDRTLEDDPGRPALVGRSGRFTYAELDRAANRAAHALAALGVEPGDRVAASLPNDVDIVIAFLGTARLGAIWVGINLVLAPPEKVYMLRDAGARVFLADPNSAAQVDPARDRLPALQHRIEVDPSDRASEWAQRLACADPAPRPEPPIDAFSPAAIADTSGTTGFPKGAVHSHRNLLLPGVVARETRVYDREVRHGAVLPLTILNLVVLVPILVFADGGCCVCMDRIDPEGIAEWVKRERIGHFAGVPTIFHDLLTHPKVKPADLVSLVRPEVGGAECPEEFRRLYRERFGSEVTIGYGMTEAPTAVARSDGRSAPRPGLCGTAVPQVELSIRDDEGRSLPSGEVGEICVGPARSGPWAGVYSPMLGYWKRPEETAKALAGGVYHSGDLGLLDEAGNLFIRGRKSELILRGGANVYPTEVERALQEHPAVAACAVLGLPDARLGQRVVAAVQLEAGACVGPDALRRHALAQLARCKVPDEFRSVEVLPRNAMGKVLKRELTGLFDGGGRE